MTPEESLRLLALPEAVTARWREQLDERHRRYHGFAHIRHLLADLPDACISRELVAAIWLHDIVYDPRASDNEERSAEQARRDLAGSGVDIERVVALVLGTKRHDGDEPEQRVMNDLDLAILSAPPADYARYAEAIREEYDHVPDAAFRVGRAQVLRGFLALPAIYRDERSAAREAPARLNIAAELASLEAAAG